MFGNENNNTELVLLKHESFTPRWTEHALQKIAPSFNPMQLSTLGDLIHLFLALSLVLLLFWLLFLYVVLF